MEPDIQKANLGLATTRELLAELTARIDVMGQLDYLTVGGLATNVDSQHVPTSATEDGFAEETEVEVAADHPAWQRVIRTKSTADRVYLIDEEKGTRQWVTNPQILEGLGFSQADVVEIEDEEMLKYQQAQALYRADA